MSDKLYDERDAMALDEAGDYYSRHVFAMTAESLYSKSAIAAELGHRDMLIDLFKGERDQWERRACTEATRVLDLDELNGELLAALHGVADILDELSREQSTSRLQGGAAGAASGIRKSIIKIMGAEPAAGEGV